MGIKMLRPPKWYLIENNKHSEVRFTSEKKLRTYAKDQGLAIKRSPTDHNCFYTESYQYVPAGEIKK